MRPTPYLFLLVLNGCNETKAPAPPLLGVRSERAIAHVTSSCNGRLDSDGVEGNGFHSEWLECALPNDESYRIKFDGHGRIDEVSISAPEKDALSLFDRVIAPIVPDAIRASMRASISDPRSFSMRPGPCVALTTVGAGWQTGGSPRQISWHLDDCVARPR